MIVRVKRGALAAVAAVGVVSVAPAGAVPAGAVAAAPVAKVIAEVRVKDQALDITVDTPNVTSMDPKARIFTPKGWSKAATRTWPVLYVFAGGADTYDTWDRITDVDEYAKKYDVIVVTPESGLNGGFVDWHNRGEGGPPKWETFHVRDLTRIIERDYRGSTTRAAMGISSGAQGAMTYAARFPGLFKYVAAYSGIMHATMPGIPAMLIWTDASLNQVADPFAKFGDPLTNRRFWLEHDPYVLAENLRGVGLYISSGTTGMPGPLDPTWAELLEQNGGDPGKALSALTVGNLSERLLGATAKSLITKLKVMNIPVTAHLYGDGLHNWPSWTREFKLAWPLIMKALGAKKVA